MTITPTHPDLPYPAGALVVTDWADPAIAGEVCRAFSGASWTVEREKLGPVRLSISGVQHTDGRVERDIFVDGGEDGLTPGQAVQLARHLLSAADEVDQMARRDGMEVTR